MLTFLTSVTYISLRMRSVIICISTENTDLRQTILRMRKAKFCRCLSEIMDTLITIYKHVCTHVWDVDYRGFFPTYATNMCVFQVEPQTGNKASTFAHSTSAVASSTYSTTDVTTFTEPSDRTTTSSAGIANITIDCPANEMKKTIARHIACGVAGLSKLRCNGSKVDHPP